MYISATGAWSCAIGSSRRPRLSNRRPFGPITSATRQGHGLAIHRAGGANRGYVSLQRRSSAALEIPSTRFATIGRTPADRAGSVGADVSDEPKTDGEQEVGPHHDGAHWRRR